MHGRVKVRTTAEQEKIRELEKQKKAAEFRKGVDFVFQKRKNQEWDDEIFLLTEKLLVRYPDVYTLWNVRREGFLNNKWSDEDRVERLEKELILTESSLRENPKSYCVWHQRTWIIEQLPNPNYKRELELCKKCLNLDERNFHCWDYRLFIVKKANISDQEELEFTKTKILNNFSNYSSWHYRSRLLRKLYPSTVHDLPIRADKHDEELDLVMNATFTDPNDSSAWFYQRWLLDYWKSPVKLWRVVITDVTITAAFHKEVSLDFELLVNGNKIECDWKPANGKKFCTVWYAELENCLCDESSEVLFKFEGSIYSLKILNSFKEWIYQSEKLSGNQNDSKLKEQLENYKVLLQMEPSNKWAKLTSAHLMLNINPIDANSDIIKELSDLITVDPLRENYYKDMRSKCILEYCLHAVINDNNKNKVIRNVDLSNLKLTSLSSQEPYLAFLHEVNLRNNNLENKIFQLYTLQQCRKLDLSNNAVSSLKKFPKMKNLRILLLSNNHISESQEILDLVGAHNLEKLNVKGNPIVDIDSLVSEIKKLSQTIEVLV
ncbi:geranylgeranyl transferase type-2 subunit alpha [Copidosoma floridanum]|uniref:geranylgeranyl transferase type-2 subunit alpha n=1 Tax=Copidosoma floridanum TaxID=29053 RepID=UPI000C6F545C|nr:geranylgeranyl transferase type-2 subunit alpha [Copidosoma floridanum]